MSRLEDLQPNASVLGILPHCLVTVVSTQWFGSEALELTYKDPGGKVANELLYRHDEPRIEVAAQGRPWSFDGRTGNWFMENNLVIARLDKLSRNEDVPTGTCFAWYPKPTASGSRIFSIQCWRSSLPCARIDMFPEDGRLWVY